MSAYEMITQFIGSVVVYAGGGVAIAFGLFVFFGKRFIDSKFQASLEKYKSEQNAELEKLKLKINTLFNKVLKTQEREYYVLPTLWKNLQRLRTEVGIAVNMFKELPPLDRYDEESLENFIKSTALPEGVAKRLRNESNKIDIYSDYLDWKQLREAQKAFWKFDEYYRDNKIFLNKGLKEKFAQIHTNLWSVWVDRKMSMDKNVRTTDFLTKAYEGMRDKVDPLLNEIEDLVQQHLYDHNLI